MLHHGNDKLAEALRTLGFGGSGALRGVVSEDEFSGIDAKGQSSRDLEVGIERKSADKEPVGVLDGAVGHGDPVSEAKSPLLELGEHDGRPVLRAHETGGMFTDGVFADVKTLCKGCDKGVGGLSRGIHELIKRNARHLREIGHRNGPVGQGVLDHHGEQGGLALGHHADDVLRANLALAAHARVEVAKHRIRNAELGCELLDALGLDGLAGEVQMGENRGERNARVFRDGLRIETERGHAFLKIKVEFVRLLTGGLVGGHVNLHEGRRAPARAARIHVAHEPADDVASPEGRWSISL